MKITPLDVGNHRFPSRWRGYDPREVEIFLEMVSQEMDELIQENRFLTEDLKKKSSELSDYKEKEQILKETMITAQRVSDDMKNNMVKEAQVIVAQAELEHDSIIRRAQDRVITLQDEIQALKDDRVRFREELRSLLRTYLALLESGEKGAVVQDDEADTNLRIMPARVRKAVE
ncbi:MAG TPA: DivIVA domain-containing protein [bacterium]|nr:DivIVA domain-containing protein [bacterium]